MKKAEEIGLTFKNARESKGITISQAAEAIRIRKIYLQALEDGKWQDLPGNVYLIGYVKNYASYLNLLELENFTLEKETTPKPKKLVNKHFRNFKLLLLSFVTLLLILLLIIYYRTYNSTHIVEKYLQAQPDFLELKLFNYEKEIIGPDLEIIQQILNFKNKDD